MNTFGTKFRLTTFGESHGIAIGGVVDGIPAGLKIDANFIQNELDKRRPGGKFATARKEADKIELLSGIFDGISTGTPIGFIIRNENQHSSDYENIKSLFRPGHADFTYFHKYGIRDYRGGGRSSARETAIRVAGGAISQLLLNEFGICVQSGVLSVGAVNFGMEIYENLDKFDFEFAANSEVFALLPNLETEFKDEILRAKNSHDSVGAVVLTRIKNPPIGLGEGLYNKIDAKFAEAMMGINGVKAVEIGAGINASRLKGSQNNDQMDKNGFKSNFSGGILGGMTNGNDILIKTYFKPTPSIFLPQSSINSNGSETEVNLKGRHDPCIGIRGSVVATAMTRLVLGDMLLLNATAKMENLRKIYGK